MGGIRALCCTKGDQRDIDHTPPNRPVQKPLEKTTHPLAENVHNRAAPIKETKEQIVPHDIDRTPPSRPVQTPLEQTTQPLAENVHNETAPVKGARKETDPGDLWTVAYESLDPDRKKYLSVDGISATEAIDGVIADTTAKYEEWTKGGLKIQLKDGVDFNIRDSAEKIISAAMNVSDVIKKFVSFDPTGHGAY